MISVKDLLYKINMKLNKKASSEYQSIPIEDAILALNEAQIKLVKKKLSVNNIYGLGLDSFKKRYQDLQILVQPFEKLAATKGQLNIAYNFYNADVTKLSKKYFLPLDIYTICSKGECKERAVYISRITKHGDLSTLMGNNYYNPSFEYQEGLAIITNNNIEVYTDGSFSVDEVYISYLRYPQYIDYEGYEKLDGTPSIIQDCELEEYLEGELLDLTIQELAMDTQNNEVLQQSEIRNKINE